MEIVNDEFGLFAGEYVKAVYTCDKYWKLRYGVLDTRTCMVTSGQSAGWSGRDDDYEECVDIGMPLSPSALIIIQSNWSQVTALGNHQNWSLGTGAFSIDASILMDPMRL